MISLLSCSNTNQLADFCALAVPSIWGPLKQQSMKRTIAFKQFCQKVIKATQISYACIVLGLYYIHRLRSAYPYIHASIGSEIRLFTTALVLANKYLDDNTFTNKTWSEVSSIPISELNIMEMEFLSALHYNIHLPHDQYFQWVGQCQQWILPTIMQIKAQTNSTPTSPLTPTMKRSYQDTVDDHYQTQLVFFYIVINIINIIIFFLSTSFLLFSCFFGFLGSYACFFTGNKGAPFRN
ncbi:cyclin-domain-containing protein [Absidia repens]|uniref:Cyclin-domain-containing protein n=1 Tax=Absidia repens TaxID=90262 RepID=A0A1X2IAT0_9FUNG|nr:cyclin-domain-containing protein [Absidia repens]